MSKLIANIALSQKRSVKCLWQLLPFFEAISAFSRFQRIFGSSLEVDWQYQKGQATEVSSKICASVKEMEIPKELPINQNPRILALQSI